jgi:hypothetical protein
MADQITRHDGEPLHCNHRILSSDVAHILRLIPEYETLTFRRRLEGTTNTLILFVGECGDSKILVDSNGRVHKVVVRGSKLRPVGHTILVDKPLNEHFKPIAPFGWSTTIKAGIYTPMKPTTSALVSMYMHLYAAKRDASAIVLPRLEYDDLHQALSSLKRAFEINEVLPKTQQQIPTEWQELYREQLFEAAHRTSDTETGSPTTTLSTSPQPVAMSNGDMWSPATEGSGIHLVGDSPGESSTVLEKPLEQSPEAEDQAMDLDVASSGGGLVVSTRSVEYSPITKHSYADMGIGLPENESVAKTVSLERSPTTESAVLDLNVGSPECNSIGSALIDLEVESPEDTSIALSDSLQPPLALEPPRTNLVAGLHAGASEVPERPTEWNGPSEHRAFMVRFMARLYGWGPERIAEENARR